MVTVVVMATVAETIDTTRGRPDAVAAASCDGLRRRHDRRSWVQWRGAVRSGPVSWPPTVLEVRVTAISSAVVVLPKIFSWSHYSGVPGARGGRFIELPEPPVSTPLVVGADAPKPRRRRRILRELAARQAIDTVVRPPRALSAGRRRSTLAALLHITSSFACELHVERPSSSLARAAAADSSSAWNFSRNNVRVTAAILRLSSLATNDDALGRNRNDAAVTVALRLRRRFSGSIGYRQRRRWFSAV